MLTKHTTAAVGPGPAGDISRLAAEDALGRAEPDESALLRRPEKLDEWRDALTGLIQQTDAEFSKRRADLTDLKDRSRHSYREYQEGMRQHAHWSSRANHFLACLRVRLAEAKRLQRHRNDARHAATVGELTQRVDALELQMAILRRSAEPAGQEVRS